MNYTVRGGGGTEYVYYLNKIMHSIDWFYAVSLPEHFGAEHPLGSVLGRANYGDYFFIYQGCTVGGNRKGGTLYYPDMGHHCVMFANSSIIGKCNIENNVILSSYCHVKDEDVPDNCIVFGESPHLIIKERTEEEIHRMISNIWR